MTSDQLPVTSDQWEVTSDQWPVTSRQLPVTSHQLPVTCYQLLATSILDTPCSEHCWNIRLPPHVTFFLPYFDVICDLWTDARQLGIYVFGSLYSRHTEPKSETLQDWHLRKTAQIACDLFSFNFKSIQHQIGKKIYSTANTSVVCCRIGSFCLFIHTAWMCVLFYIYIMCYPT